MVLWIKYLLHKDEVLSSDPQYCVKAKCGSVHL